MTIHKYDNHCTGVMHTNFNMAISSGERQYTCIIILSTFQHVRGKKKSVPLTAAVLKNFSELASETWKRGEWNEQNITYSKAQNLNVISFFHQNAKPTPRWYFWGRFRATTAEWEDIIGLWKIIITLKSPNCHFKVSLNPEFTPVSFMMWF